MTSEIRKAFLSENLSEQKDWVVFARNSEAGHSRPEHVHDVAQLLYAESGVMLLVSEGIPRLVPPHQALWIPAGIPHSLTFITETRLRTLYFPAESSKRVSGSIRAMEVSDLLRDLIAELFRNTYPPSVQKQMSRLVLSLLHGTAPTADPLPLPTDPMLRSAAEGILRESRWAVPLETLCDEVHLTPKTFERKFLKDTGMTFKAWKSAARLCSALDCLAKGMSIKQTALHLGFSGPGPFSAAFTKFFGLTPGSLVQSLRKQKDR